MSTPSVSAVPPPSTEPVYLQKVAAAVNAPIPHIYATGFNFGVTGTDVIVAFEANGLPQCVLNMSYGMAKEFAQKLGMQIQQAETDTGIRFFTPSEMDIAFAKAHAGNK